MSSLINPGGVGQAVTSGQYAGNYAYQYDVTLSQSQYVTPSSTPQSGIVTNIGSVLNLNTSTGQLNPVAGYPNTGLFATAGLFNFFQTPSTTSSTASTGLNLNFTYAGLNPVLPGTVGTFTAVSALGGFNSAYLAALDGAAVNFAGVAPPPVMAAPAASPVVTQQAAVNVVTSAPEPASMLFLASGLLAIGAFRRRLSLK